MELDINVGGESLSITIDNPFKLDMDGIMGSITEFMSGQNVTLNGLDIEGLLPRMVKGIAGCEDGCPADAKSLVSQGYSVYEISYIEGGILSAKASIEGDRVIELKMFPEF
jgi:hypothetical protein